LQGTVERLVAVFPPLEDPLVIRDQTPVTSASEPTLKVPFGQAQYVGTGTVNRR